MKIKRIYLIILSLMFFLSNTSVFAADVNFSNAKVLLVETRSDAWGGWIIITLSDNAGNRIMRLCDAAQDKGAIALRTSDSAAKDVVAIALMAKASGQTVTGWGIDAVQGGWCGIGNFAVYP